MLDPKMGRQSGIVHSMRNASARRKSRRGRGVRRRVGLGYGCKELADFIAEALTLNTKFLKMIYQNRNTTLLPDDEVHNYVLAIEKIASNYNKLTYDDRLSVDISSRTYCDLWGNTNHLKFLDTVKKLSSDSCSQVVSTHLNHFLLFLKEKINAMC